MVVFLHNPIFGRGLGCLGLSLQGCERLIVVEEIVVVVEGIRRRHVALGLSGQTVVFRRDESVDTCNSPAGYTIEDHTEAQMVFQSPSCRFVAPFLSFYTSR